MVEGDCAPVSSRAVAVSTVAHVMDQVLSSSSPLHCNLRSIRWVRLILARSKPLWI